MITDEMVVDYVGEDYPENGAEPLWMVSTPTVPGSNLWEYSHTATRSELQQLQHTGADIRLATGEPWTA